MPVHVFRVRTPDGDKDFVTLVAQSVASSNGLAGEAIVGQLLRPLQSGEQIAPDNFARNPAFVDFMHAIVARESPNLPSCRAEAERLGDGFLYVIDQRTATPAGPVPPEDIIGAFAVKGGALVAGSYTPNRNHSILSTRGFFQLDPALLDCLVKELEAVSSAGRI